MKRKNSTKKHSKEFWSQHLEAWHSNGLNQSQYCRENDINSRAFSYHKILKYGLNKAHETEPRLNLVTLPMVFGESEDSLAPESNSGISICLISAYHAKQNSPIPIPKSLSPSKSNP